MDDENVNERPFCTSSTDESLIVSIFFIIRLTVLNFCISPFRDCLNVRRNITIKPQSHRNQKHLSISTVHRIHSTYTLQV